MSLTTQSGQSRQARPWSWILTLLLLSTHTLVGVGCQTPGSVVIRDVNKSYNLLRRVVGANLPNGQRWVSQNGRELKSNYFPATGQFDEDGSRSKERAFAHVAILGDRRPYKIEVRVFRERRDVVGSAYETVGPDKKLAARLAEKLQDELTKRSDDINIIDEFRAF